MTNLTTEQEKLRDELAEANAKIKELENRLSLVSEGGKFIPYSHSEVVQLRDADEVEYKALLSASSEECRKLREAIEDLQKELDILVPFQIKVMEICTPGRRGNYRRGSLQEIIGLVFDCHAAMENLKSLWIPSSKALESAPVSTANVSPGEKSE